MTFRHYALQQRRTVLIAKAWTREVDHIPVLMREAGALHERPEAVHAADQEADAGPRGQRCHSLRLEAFRLARLESQGFLTAIAGPGSSFLGETLSWHL